MDKEATSAGRWDRVCGGGGCGGGCGLGGAVVCWVVWLGMMGSRGGMMGSWGVCLSSLEED